ncbi:hypothetical protein GOV03_00765 [Candidatus Woesearchaeota archaeon]|nr:hypothetical protein [Candidatus Woesearchaeota archaeon]
MRKTIGSIVLLMLFLLSVALMSAQEGETDWDTVGEMDDATFESNFINDPIGGFEADPTRAWTLIETNPDHMLKDQKLIGMTFKNDEERTMRLIDGEVDLLSNQNILERFDLEIQCTPLQGCDLLNEHSQAKVEWFKQKGYIDEGARVDAYNGVNINVVATEENVAKIKSELRKQENSRKTKWKERKIADLKEELLIAEEGNNFDLKDFPGATIKSDGSLVISVKTQKYAFMGSELTVKDGWINMRGGEAFLTSLETVEFLDIALSVNEGKLEINVEETMSGAESAIRKKASYSGSFVLDKSEEGYQIASVNEEGFVRNVFGRKATISGEIIDPVRDDDSGFIIVKNTKVKFNDYTGILVKGEQKVYYSEKSKYFCKFGYSCVINTGEGKFRTKLRFESVENKDQILFKSHMYHGAVEVNDVKEGGKVTYASLGARREEGKIQIFDKSIIVVESGGKIKVEKDLGSMRTGRFDVFFTKEDKELRSHYSSTEYLSTFSGELIEGTGAYIERVRTGNSFVTCERGNCEKVFTETFGRAIYGPKGKEPTTTIILGGDNANTAKSLETRWCKQQGCYILNSRDLPEKTDSERLVITGHHRGGEEYVFRSAEADTASWDGIGFDTLHYLDLPEGPNVKTVTFSSCSTIRKDKIKGKDPLEIFRQLNEEKFPQVMKYQGWSGTAPGVDLLYEPARPTLNLKFSKGGSGKQAWFIKKGDQWYWTKGGNWQKVALE